ncbi:MAG: CPBP family glutamic-type intramembrane protease [Pseudomonadota bacterium]
MAITLAMQAFLPPEMLENINETVVDDSVPVALLLVLLVIASPLVETVGMFVLFWLMDQRKLPLKLQIVLSAIVWGLIHNLLAPGWGYTTTWLFFIFSLVYVTQRQRSGDRAFWMTSGVHGLNNATASIGILVEMAS